MLTMYYILMDIKENIIMDLELLLIVMDYVERGVDIVQVVIMMLVFII